MFVIANRYRVHFIELILLYLPTIWMYLQKNAYIIFPYRGPTYMFVYPSIGKPSSRYYADVILIVKVEDEIHVEFP